MSADAGKALYRKVMEALNAKDFETARSHIADDYTWHGPGGATLQGIAQWREMVEGYFTAFPDLELHIGNVAAEGDLVAAHWSATGTHLGALGDMAATGKKIDITGNHMFRVADGKLAEEWETFDEMAMMQQIGAIPA